MQRVLPLLLACICLAWNASAQIKQTPSRILDWPYLYDTSVILDLEFTMDPGDWSTVQNDTSFSIEVPAWLSAPGETPILVSMRRKSSDALKNGTNFAKVGLKIDINEYVTGQEWHGVKKLSLENGDDENVLTEGFAWAIHQLAYSPSGYSTDPGFANWARVKINGTPIGLYLNVEQRDKQYLKNRGLWTSNQTWLYKLGDIYSDELKHGSSGGSPTHAFLCYDPFQSPNRGCSTPDLATFEADLLQRVDMQQMLTMGAVNAFLAHGDSLFSKGKNIYFVDFLIGKRRAYLPWDLDSVLNQTQFDIFNPGAHYADHVLAVPSFRDAYKQIMTQLLDGPMHTSRMHAFLDRMEPILTSALAADPNNRIGDAAAIAAEFQSLRDWVVQRDAVVRQQIAND